MVYFFLSWGPCMFFWDEKNFGQEAALWPLEGLPADRPMSWTCFELISLAVTIRYEVTT